MTRAELLSLRSKAALRKALNIQHQCWISLWCLAGFIFWKWSVRCVLFCFFCSLKISQWFFFLNGWWAHYYPSHSFDWFLRHYVFFSFLFLLFFFFIAVPFCLWLEFAQFFPCTFFFLSFFFLFDLTCGTNAKLQDRRLWVCMLNIFSKM